MVLHSIEDAVLHSNPTFLITCATLSCVLVAVAIHQLLALVRLSPRPWLRKAWAALAGLLSCALALGIYGIYLRAHAGSVSSADVLDSVIHLMGAAFILAVTLLSRRTARDILKSAFLETAALTDDLTRLPNRRQFNTVLPEQIGLARRRNHPLALVTFDIDHFKDVNDRYGHGCGDDVLEKLGEIMLATKRASDTGFRIGGEEFAILAPRTSLDEAQALAERLRRAVEAMETVVNGHTIRITISLGIAHLRPEDDVPSLTERADDALYQAKHAGRNCTRLAQVDAAVKDCA